MEPKILIVDDALYARVLVKRALEYFPFEFVEAIHGKEAEELFALYEDDIALIIMDIEMPVQDGIETARHIKAKNPDVPIVMFSARTSMENIIASVGAGVKDFLAKPANESKIRAKVMSYFPELKLPKQEPESRSILIIEPQTQRRLFLKYLLSQRGVSVLEAADAASALRYLSRVPTPVVAVNLEMGVEALQDIRGAVGLKGQTATQLVGYGNQLSSQLNDMVDKVLSMPLDIEWLCSLVMPTV
jgi:CheY-like chemotaxis protein